MGVTMHCDVFKTIVPGRLYDAPKTSGKSIAIKVTTSDTFGTCDSMDEKEDKKSQRSTCCIFSQNHLKYSMLLLRRDQIA